MEYNKHDSYKQSQISGHATTHIVVIMLIVRQREHPMRGRYEVAGYREKESVVLRLGGLESASDKSRGLP